MWIEAFWTCLQNVFQLFETMSFKYFCKESTLFTPKNTLLERILATSLAIYEEDSLDDESFVSQSRFDAYATQKNVWGLAMSICRQRSKGEKFYRNTPFELAFKKERIVKVPTVLRNLVKFRCRMRLSSGEARGARGRPPQWWNSWCPRNARICNKINALEGNLK